jgi:voltage-gated potassium channel
MSSKQRLLIALTAIIGLLATGTIGYKMLLGIPWFDCFYFALITLTSIGYSEPPEMTEPARYFNSILIILGVSTIGYALTVVAQSIVQIELISTFGRRKMFKDINSLKGHFIVCGAGRIGSGIIREIARSGQDFVVIEQNEPLADRLLSQGYLVLMGDSTSEEVLLAAGINRARGLVCAVSSDPDNLYITLTARDINKDLYIVARANEEAALPRLLKAGANKVVSPSITGAHQMAQMLLRPAVADFIELATMTEELELEIEQIEIQPASPFINCQLKDTSIRSDTNVIVIAIKRKNGQMLFNPVADTLIEEGDALIAMGAHTNLVALEQMANPNTRSNLIHRH